MARFPFEDAVSQDELVTGWRDVEEGRTVAFSVGLRIHTPEGWREVVRYDTVHGRLRIHRFDITGRDEAAWLQTRPPLDHAAALERAVERLRRNRLAYRTRFVARAVEGVA